MAGHYWPNRGRRVGDAARRMPASPERSVEAIQRMFPRAGLVALKSEAEHKRDLADEEKATRKLKTMVLRAVKANPIMKRRRDKRRRPKHIASSTFVFCRKLKLK